MFLHISFCVISGLYPRGWDPDLTFLYLSKRISQCWVFSPAQARGFSEDSNQSLRYVWSFSLCPEVGVGPDIASVSFL